MINLTPGLKGTSEANVSKPSYLPLPQEEGLEGGVSGSRGAGRREETLLQSHISL